MNENQLYEQWLIKADEDFYFASNHLEDEKSFFGQICFHYHQAAEKYLKSYIVAYNLPFIKIHNLKELLHICKRRESAFSEIEDECIYLNQFYIETRYPVHWPSHFSKEEAYKAKQSADKIRKFIIKRLRTDKKSAFTLIELMIVITILGVLAAMVSGNFITSLKKGRDARRKADLEQIQRALEMYYEDKKVYPTAGAAPGFVFGSQFTDSVTGKIYMQRVPNDPISGKNYGYESADGTDYRLYACLENSQQILPYNSLTGSPPISCNVQCWKQDQQSGTTTCYWAISSPNTTP